MCGRLPPSRADVLWRFLSTPCEVVMFGRSSVAFNDCVEVNPVIHTVDHKLASQRRGDSRNY